jgi:hypothetical protein
MMFYHSIQVLIPMSEYQKLSPRKFARQICRIPEFFSPYKNSDIPIAPVDSNSSWLGQVPLLYGLSKELPTPEISTSASSYGRVIVQDANLFALICNHHGHPVVPPFPGPPPDGFHEWMRPDLIFMDGTRGRWDFTRYPQLFDAERPWRAFASIPIRFDAPEKPELWPVTEFWAWSDRCSSARGGWWKYEKIKKLIDRRSKMEERIQESCPSFFDWKSYKTPWFDSLELVDVSGWKTYRDGRECISLTLQYTAELYAMDRWFLALKHVKQATPLPEPSFGFMGVWAQTITTRDQWDFLVGSQVPIYLLIKVPPNHRLANQAISGNLDGDERYRHSPFDASLRRSNFQRSIRIWKYSLFATNQECNNPVHLLPNTIQPPRPSTLVDESSTAWYLPFTTYPWQDGQIFRGYYPQSAMRQRVWEEERRLFSVLLPTQPTLAVGRTPHPLLIVLPEARDAGTTYFEEMHDPGLGYWPRRFDPSEWDSVCADTTYIFRFDSARIVILSLYPFPGQCRTLGYWPKSALAKQVVESLPSEDGERKYFKSKPSQDSPPAYTWRPMCKSFDLIDDNVYYSRYSSARLRIRNQATQADQRTSQGTKSLALPVSSKTRLDSLVPPQIHDVMTRSPPDSMEVDAETPQPSAGELLNWVKSQQTLVDQQLRRRFFHPRGELEHKTAHLTKLQHPKNAFVAYPIRIANLHGETSAAQLFGIINACIGSAEVVAYSFYIEVDTTCTYILGFRYAEDALRAWSSIHGLRYRDRLIEAVPFASLVGSCRAFQSNFEAVTATSVRIEKLKDVLDREAALDRETGPIAQDAKLVLEQLEREDFADASPRMPSASPSASFPPLEPRLDITPTANFTIPELLPGSFAVKGCSPTTSTILTAVHSGSLSLKELDGCANKRVVTVLLEEKEEGEVGEDKEPGTQRHGQNRKQLSYAGAPRHHQARGSQRSNRGISSQDSSHQYEPPDIKGRQLNGMEKRKLRRVLLHRAETIGKCWKDIKLPDFPIKDETQLIPIYKAVWKWNDICLQALDKF